MQLPSIKLTHKVSLLLVVPLVIALIFVSLLIVNLNQAEQDIEAEARAEEILNLVNETVRDAMGACGGMLILRMYHEQKVLHDTTQKIHELKQDRERIAALIEKNPNDAAALQEFVARLDQGNAMFATVLQMGDDDDSISSLRVMGQMKTFSEVLNFEGDKITERKSDEQRVLRQKRKEDRRRIELLIQLFMGFGIVLALALSFALTNTVFRRFGTLMRNAMNIGLGKPLEQPLHGSDELAQLDSVIHQLSEDLNILRLNERAMIDNAAEIICSLDRALRIAQINPAVERILGYDANEVLGTALQSLVHADDKAAVYEHLKGLSSVSPQVAFEARIQSKSGAYVETAWMARWSQQDRSIFCVAHDITERKEAERLKQELFAMVSHDLRSPLTSVSMTLEMLDEGILGTLNERGTKLAGSANESVKSLMILINDLLESERMAQMGMILDYENTDLDKIVQQAVDFVTPEASSKKIELSVTGSCRHAQVDSEKVRRVLVNLLNNAIKFSPRDATITASMQDIDEPHNPQIEIRIIDEGPGIPADKHALVFEKFKQAGRRDEGERKGSGLGLSICKAIVEAHGGTIGVMNGATTGSIFWFRLPLAPVVEKASRTVAS